MFRRPRVACESVGNVVLIEGHDFLYADGRADFLGYAGLFVRREDAHHIGHVAVSHDFDACLGGRAEAQQGGADFGCTPSVVGHVAERARLRGNGDVVVHAFGGLFGTGDAFNKLFFAFGSHLAEQEQVWDF